MFCGYCGKEIKDGTAFCPNCGKKAAVNSAGQPQEVDLEFNQKDILKNNILKAKKANRKFWIPFMLVICLTVGYFGYQKIVEYKISSEIDNSLAMVQNGVDNETADQILQYAVPQLVDNEMIANIILENVSGEDVMDIYLAMMRYMEYEVSEVTRVEHNHYQAVVRIYNLNNGLVASHAAEIFMERYHVSFPEKVLQFLDDASADKSQLAAEVMSVAADECYESGDDSYWIYSEQVIDIVNNNGEWIPSLDYISFAYSCLGLG